MEDLKLAAMVHYSFLPEDYEDERIIVASTLRPLYTIGGDFCSIIPLDDDHLLICTCDAVGHGVSAALFAARINTYVRGCKKLCVNGLRRLQPVTTGGTDDHTQRSTRYPDEGLQKS